LVSKTLQKNNLIINAVAHRWRNLYRSGGAQVHVKKLWKMFVAWMDNCDVTSIEIWRHYLHHMKVKITRF